MPEYFCRASSLLPERLRRAAAALSTKERASCEELRLRVGQPCTLRMPEGEIALTGESVTPDILAAVLEKATGASLHAFEDELRRGFVSAPGGVRVGVCGTAVCAPGTIQTMRDVSSLCIRIPRPVPGAGKEILPWLTGKSVLILSPPGGGKTTFLRELVRVVSDSGVRVALADELLADRGAVRVHGGGFGGTIQAFVPADRAQGFATSIDAVLGDGACMICSVDHEGIRSQWL